MPRFFTDNICKTTATVTGEDARHIARSLRCRMGEELTLCDGRGTDYRCCITDIGDTAVTLAVCASAPSAAEPPVALTLYQAMPKGDKPELIIQKAVELGASRVVFVLTERCVSRPDAGSMKKKLERWNKISVEAAKQSGRGVLPVVEGLLTLPQAIAELQGHELGILFYERATASLGAALHQHPRSVGLLVGSEGGFSEAEAAQCAAAGLAVCTMGPRILRCETAPLYALSAITFCYENQ